MQFRTLSPNVRSGPFSEVTASPALVRFTPAGSTGRRTQALNLSAGVSNCKVSRGRSFMPAGKDSRQLARPALTLFWRHHSSMAVRPLASSQIRLNGRIHLDWPALPLKPSLGMWRLAITLASLSRAHVRPPPLRWLGGWSCNSTLPSSQPVQIRRGQ
jgi:hypothetical protein